MLRQEVHVSLLLPPLALTPPIAAPSYSNLYSRLFAERLALERREINSMPTAVFQQSAALGAVAAQTSEAYRLASHRSRHAEIAVTRGVDVHKALAVTKPAMQPPP